MSKAKREDFDPRLFEGICHRGYWGEGRTENGMAAFEEAIKNGFAFELDIHLTADKQLIVCHDSELERTTGKQGIIEELTLEEIKRDYRLLDGGEVPTFEEVLDLNNERVPIVVELKTHKSNFRALAKKAMKALERIKDTKTITVISFDPRSLLFVKKKRFTRGLLIYNKRPDILATLRFFDYLDIEDVMLGYDKVIKYRKAGGLVNSWTIETEEQLDHANKMADMITFQHLPFEKVREVIHGTKGS